jgi:parallel beta-helix repeat protein
MPFESAITSVKSRFVLLLSMALLTLSLAAAAPAAAATCNVPTGTNAFATIQAAIDSTTPLCTVINVKAGTYPGPITIHHNLTLSGASMATTTINLAGNTNPTLDAIVKVVAPATQVTIQRFTIRGPGFTNCGSLQYGILVRDGAKATIQNNRLTAIGDTRDPVTNAASGCQNGNAIQIGRNLLSTTGHAVVRNNTIDDYQKTGIIVDGQLAGPVSTATITGNKITGDVIGTCFPDYRCSPSAAQNAIQISRNANAMVSGNTVTENRYDPAVTSSVGILLFDAGSNVTLSANMADRNDVGIYVIGNGSTTVVSNKVKNSTFDGIALDGSDFNTVRTNTLNLNGNGIGLYDADSNVIERNTVSTSDSSGYFVDVDSTGNFLRMNRALQNFTFGMEDESTGAGTVGTGNSYTGNSCTGNGTAKSDPAGLC